MDIYKADDYRQVIKEKIEEYPHKGHGKMSELSRSIGVHSTLISQVLKEHKDLSSDQVLLVAKFFGLTDLETDYLSTLLLFNRSSNQVSKKHFLGKIKHIRKQSKNLSKRVKKDFELSEEQKAVYYSDWSYAAICQVVALPYVKSIEDISKSLNLSKEKVREDLEFLFEVGLIIKDKGELRNGVSSLHLAKTSPWIRAHHINWRQRAIESLSDPKEEDLHYSAPLTLSKEDGEKLYERFAKVVEEMRKTVDPSPSEEFYCLNIDWFKCSSDK